MSPLSELEFVLVSNDLCNGERGIGRREKTRSQVYLGSYSGETA